MGPDNTVHYIDPAGENVLVPKTSSKAPDKTTYHRTMSDSDIPKTFPKNNKNIKLVPMDQKKVVDGNRGGAAPPAAHVGGKSQDS